MALVEGLRGVGTRRASLSTNPHFGGARAGSRTLNLGIKSQSISRVMACHERQGVSPESENLTQLRQQRQGVSLRVSVKLSNKLSGGRLTTDLRLL